jgi:cytochrome c nitrite reductase small subunit
MGEIRGRRAFRVVVIAAAAVLVVSVFLLVGPPKLLAKSDRADFCVSCHVMESQYEAWAHTGAHRREQCVECHLPNQNKVLHYVWKGIDGFKDVAIFYSGAVPERIKLTSHGEDVLRANCVRCHEAAVTLMKTDRKCWDCHRRISHQRSGAMATI